MEHQLLKENISARIRWLMLGRVTIITFLLAIATFSEIKGAELLPERFVPSYYVIIVITYSLSFLYLFLLKRNMNLVTNVYVQAACDTMLITYLVFVTGGTGSIYSVFYTLVIIYAVLFLGRRGGFIIASACCIFYGTLLNLEYYGVIYPQNAVIMEYSFRAGYIFSRIAAHILSFYLIAFLTSFVVEQEKKVRTLLVEKESAFDQLDLLHRSIVESVNVGILTINLAGKIKSFNRAAQDITEYSLADVEDKNVSDMFPLDINALMKSEIKQFRARNRFDMTFRTKGGRKLILGCSISELKNSNNERIGDILIFQDLTSLKEMEESYEKSRKMAFIGEMAARLAHEIRNPLASISGSIQVLSRDLSLSDSDERLMGIIMRGKEQLENFMRDFLMLARPTLGTREVVDSKVIIEEVLEALKYGPDWREDIELCKKLQDNMTIMANRAEIRQVLWNLILNAIQSLPSQGTLTVELSERYNGTLKAVEIIVADDGSGIGETELGKIFEPFYTTKEKGTGLGLAIVSRIAERNDWRIKINSEVGRGTKCVLLLPLYAP